MRYPGGKFRCYQKLINLIPKHRVYIESHLGGGAIIRHKAPAEQNIGIDPDDSVIKSFSDFPHNYRFAAARAEDFLTDYSFQGDEFVYADPPYIPSSRKSKRSVYAFDYTEQDHIDLLGIMLTLPCKVMISGYDNDIYASLLTNWNVIKFSGTSHIGKREETVWLNYAPTEIHDTRFLGHTFRDRQSIKRKRERWITRFKQEPISLQQALLSDLHQVYAQSRKEASGC